MCRYDSLNASSVYFWSAGADGYAGTDDDVRLPVSLLPATDGSAKATPCAAFSYTRVFDPTNAKEVAKADVTNDLTKAHFLLVVTAPPKPLAPMPKPADKKTEKKTTEAVPPG